MTVQADRVTQATTVAQESILDEIDRFVARYVSCSDEQRWAMILYAAATHSIRKCATFGRMLFASEEEESGKTVAMMVTVALCSRPIDAAGTPYDLTAALADAHLEPEKPIPTFYRDEIGEVFPNGGSGSGNNVVGDILRRGYKRRATRGRARNGTSQRFSIFTPFLMTGLRTAVPRDIRSRCIVISMKRGVPKEYFDVRDAEENAYTYGRILSQEIGRHLDEIEQFRVLQLGIPGLSARRGEVWEPLLAAALALGGKRWLSRGVAAFKGLALAQSEVRELTPGQKLMQAVVELTPGLTLDGFVPGNALADELRRLPQYEGRSLASAAKLISDEMPVNTIIRRLSSGDRLRGYQLTDIQEAWERIRPLTLDEMEEPEEVNPFDVLDDESESDDEGEEEWFEPPLEAPGIPLAPVKYLEPRGTGGAGGFAHGAHAGVPAASLTFQSPVPDAEGVPWTSENGVKGSVAPPEE